MGSAEYWRKRTLESEAYANGLAESEIVRQQKLYKAAYKQLAKQIDGLYIQVVEYGEELSRTQLWNFSRWYQLEQRLGKITGDITTNQIRGTERTLIKVFEKTMGVTLEDLKQSGAPVNLSFDMLDNAQIKQLVNTAWNDASFSQRYIENGIKMGARVKQDITDMLISGKSPGAIKKALQGDLNMNYYAADRLVRTEANHYYNDAAMKSYKAAGVIMVEYIAEVDDRICDECEGYSGQIYPIDGAPTLPIHPNCRCCYAPVVEVGDDLTEAAELLKKYA